MPSFGKKTLIRENKTIGLDKVAQPNISLGNFLFMPKKEKLPLQSRKTQSNFQTAS
jgi:hypothetical protein